MNKIDPDHATRIDHRSKSAFIIDHIVTGIHIKYNFHSTCTKNQKQIYIKSKTDYYQMKIALDRSRLAHSDEFINFEVLGTTNTRRVKEIIHHSETE